MVLVFFKHAPFSGLISIILLLRGFVVFLAAPAGFSVYYTTLFIGAPPGFPLIFMRSIQKTIKTHINLEVVGLVIILSPSTSVLERYSVGH